MIPPDPDHRERGFVAVMLLTATMIVALVVAFNAIVDPLGTIGTDLFPTATWSDRGEKVDLIENLKVPPELVVLGSSRAMKVEPSYLQKKTGLPTFNAGVSSGMPWDAFVFTSLLAERFPDTRQRYLWFLDLESFRTTSVDSGLLNDPRLSKYLRGRSLRDILAGYQPLLSWQTAALSVRLIRSHAGQTGKKAVAKVTFDPDGFRAYDTHDAAVAKGASLKERLPGTIKTYKRMYSRDFTGLDADAQEYMVRTLAAMNERGATPLIVIPPEHADLIAALRPNGWQARHDEVLAYLRGLQSTYRFTLLDMSHDRDFGGDPSGYYDGLHLLVPNVRKLVDASLARSDKALE